MNHRTKSALAFLLTLCVIAGFFPGGTITARAADNVKYLDASGAEQTAASATEVTNQTTWSAGWYVVSGSVTIASRITVSGGVHLILADGADLNAKKGITVKGTNSLTIYAQSTDETTMGKLTAKGGSDGAGIGGGDEGAGGTITVNGGTVTANGGIYSAGIGGGYSGASGSIAITGGMVNANGNVGGSDGGGAGIGGGEDGAAGNSISITGGTVTATVPNGTQGAAIGNGGGSDGKNVNTVTIGEGATVEAGANKDGTGAVAVTNVANNKSYKYAKITFSAPLTLFRIGTGTRRIRNLWKRRATTPVRVTPLSPRAIWRGARRARPSGTS